MRYLASIGQKSLFGQQLLHLHCKEVDRYTWESVKEEVAIDINHKFSRGTLIVAHLTVTSHRVQRIEEATQAIISTLNGFSKIGRQYRELSQDIEAWRDSMKMQVEELRRREEELMERAEALKINLVCTLGSPDHLIIPQSFDDHLKGEEIS